MEEKTQTQPQSQPAAAEPKPSQKSLVVGVQFRTAGKIYTFVSEDASLARGDAVVVSADGGTAFGRVARAPKEIENSELPQNVKKVIRRATAKDVEEEARIKEKAMEYFSICAEKVRDKNLSMKLIDAQIEEGGKKAVFIFFAEQRVDFRALVKELAQTLHMRIEMRQVGARDETKYKGCLGPCGLQTCCSGHLRQFESISISMAKHQGLSPNPPKLTGMCGKLKCCLAYENEVYNEYRKSLLKVGLAVSSPRGAGKITGHNVLKRECVIKLFGGGEFRCPCDSCTTLTAEEKDAAIKAAIAAEEQGEERARRMAERRGNRGGGRDRNNRDKNNRDKNGKDKK